MRVRDLLTMSTGHHDEDIRDFPFTLERQPGEGVPRAAGAAQAGHALPLQHAGDLHALGDRPEGRPGQTVLDYLRPRLFEPLGIENPTWETSPQGVSLGGFGLSVRTEDIARFGQLYLQKGKWQGKQLVPAAWVEAATVAPDVERQHPDERLGPGLRLPVLALPPRRLPRRRRLRPVLHRPAASRTPWSRSPAARATCSRS